MPSKNEKKSEQTGAKATKSTQFRPGNPGGPGRPAGSRNRASVLLDQIADKEAEAILRKVIEAAREGDQRSAEIILSRIWPPRKGRSVTLDLPAIDTPADIVKALGIVATAVGTGDITPEEGSAVASVIEYKRKAIETDDLDRRITQLEQERNK
jgi:ethanolamine utilization microcompartment shell protein EutS